MEELRVNLSNILNDFGFKLRKWRSNVPHLSDDLGDNITEVITPSKTLGISWNSKTDEYCYSFNNSKFHDNITKRNILSITAKMYDPIVFLAAIIIVPKLIIQEL